ncbi:flagellar hook-length control protein FliK [Catenovulum sp. 2E275]|uniref:flagellar hook-length control protein FliK n=1 Tax=Catenovulum sp. 2E275 TaxID=2980497 RepID=UPI0021D1AB5E|nr:flagellar hook-length control protein FliK [Catenovulum sp. 2E275]MCU4675792.1 flagellar hook-length control protein FliK [Catenovulum sp. 2E275]
MTHNTYFQQLEPNIRASQLGSNKDIVQYTTQQNQFRQAALVKVDQVMSQLKFPTGQRLDLKLNPAQQAQFQNNAQVEVSLQDQALTIRQSGQTLHKQPMSPNQVTNLANQSIERFEPNQNKANLVSAQVKQNQAYFNFEGRQYQLNVPPQLQQQQTVFLLVKPNKNTLEVSFVNQEQNSVKLTNSVAAEQNANKLIIGGQSFAKLSIPNAHYQVFLQSGDAVFQAANGQQYKFELNQLSAKLSQFLLQSLNQQAQLYLIKNIDISDQLTLNIAKQNIALTPPGLKSQTFSAEQSLQLANIKITASQAEIMLANGAKFQFELPLNALAQQNLNYLSATPKYLLNQLVALNVLEKAQANSILNQLSDGQIIRAQLNKSLNGQTHLTLSAQAKGSIEINLTQALKAQLIDSKLFKLANPTNHSDAASNTTDNLISPDALLKQLNQNKTPDLALSATQLQQLKQLAHQQQNNLSQSLQTLLESLNQNKTQSPALLQSLNSLKQPVSAEQLQTQIQSQLQIPTLLSNLTNLNAPQSTGLAGQLIQALQILFTAKAKAALTQNKLKADKANVAKSPTSHQNNQQVNQKQTQNLADSVKHFQFNQLKTAEQQAQGQNQIYASIPFNFAGKIEHAEVSLQCKADEFNDEEAQAVKLWKFSIKFNFDELGKLLIKAALVEDKLKLNVYCEQTELNQLAQQKLDWLKKRLILFNIQLEQTGFNLGKIPDHLWQESAVRMQYRL